MSKSHILLKSFITYLRLEKSLSPNSIEAYENDLKKLISFLFLQKSEKGLSQQSLQDLQAFIQWLAQIGLSARSQARVISGIKAFYRYLLLERTQWSAILFVIQ